MRITSFRPVHISRSHLQPTALSRQFSIAPQLRLRENKEQDPEEVEKKKQQNLKDGKQRELQSAGEEAVGADQEKVKDDKKHMEELQKETANESQRNHPKGQS